MKIFFFSTVFAPSVGGIERLVELLCRKFVENGHEVRVGTLTRCDDEAVSFPFRVSRAPTLRQFYELLKWCDVHIQANVSLKYVWPRLVSPAKVIYQHNNAYQGDDGSVQVVDRVKRRVARHSHGIANSRYTAAKVGCNRVVLNAYDDATFHTVLPWRERSRDLVFLGRLVSQKGCDTLVEAVARLRAEQLEPSLTVVGDGPDRPMLERQVHRHGLAAQVRFAGPLSGPALAAELNRHRIFVAPSRYEEPFGIVALEALACGCVPVVSARGGLVDAIGAHGFTFANGDDAALAERLARLLAEPAQAQARLEGVEAHLRQFTAAHVARRYLEVFTEVTGAR